MRHFYRFIVYHPRLILAIFAVLAALSAVCFPMVGVNYDMNDYLPEDSPSTVALGVMGEEFDGGIPNARVMLCDVSGLSSEEYAALWALLDGTSPTPGEEDDDSASENGASLSPDVSDQLPPGLIARPGGEATPSEALPVSGQPDSCQASLAALSTILKKEKP